MQNPTNHFKAALKASKRQFGIWNSIGGPTVVEQLASCGYDWVLIDTEHAPIDVNDVLYALQAVAGFPQVSAVVRPAVNDAVLIKRLLDHGAQSLLIPFVQSAQEARAAVAATRYAPRGIRGFAGITRATRYGKVTDYATRSEDEICLIVQVETAAAMQELDAIAAVEGVDGVFIGPADLAASMGHVGNPGHEDVVAVINSAIDRLAALGMPSGILSLDRDFTRACIHRGTCFTAVGVDLALLNSAAVNLIADYRTDFG